MENDMKIYVGCLIYMSIVKLPEIKDYWSKDLLLKGILSSYISRNRFELITKFFHLSNNEDKECILDKLYKVRPLLCYATKIYNTYCEPGSCFTIDEDIIGFKGIVNILAFEF